MNPLELTGRVRTHLAAATEETPALHVHVVRPFENLRRAALADGLELEPVSAFRDFERQLALWNAKWRGERPLIDTAGRPLEAALLTATARIDAILLWSALPGASRHHWGSDLDIIDRRALPAGYRVQLTPGEFAAGGPFARLDRWLEQQAPRFGFFRPFRGERSGVQAEPWHISFAPVAEPARRALSVEVLREALESAPLAGGALVRDRLAELHARYVASIDWP
ncbi:MAG TPA: M15 family metallopeptidase [Steroidobacteraceae bacterium]|nr:M15 family metallopeptidase [Steroidobacteraceae bacterium]